MEKHSDIAKLKNAAARRLQFSEVLRRIYETSPTIKVVSGWRSYETQDSLLNLICNVCSTEDEIAKFECVRTAWGSGNKIYVWRMTNR
jgi:hypothetical protein